MKRRNVIYLKEVWIKPKKNSKTVNCTERKIWSSKAVKFDRQLFWKIKAINRTPYRDQKKYSSRIDKSNRLNSQSSSKYRQVRNQREMTVQFPDLVDRSNVLLYIPTCSLKQINTRNCKMLFKYLWIHTILYRYLQF